MADTKQKTINGLVFDISQPYAAGHQISEIEAKVLNQVRSENIGNNLRAKIKEMVEAGKDQAEIAVLVAEKDAEYEFTAGNIGEGRKLDPYEAEAQKLARELLKNHLAQTGRKLTVAPEGETDDSWKAKVQEHVDRIALSDNVVKAAKQRVDARKKQADALLAAVEGTDL